MKLKIILSALLLLLVALPSFAIDECKMRVPIETWQTVTGNHWVTNSDGMDCWWAPSASCHPIQTTFQVEKEVGYKVSILR